MRNVKTMKTGMTMRDRSQRTKLTQYCKQWRIQEFFQGRLQIQLRTEGR
jgi:hypothetical protein